MRLTQTVQKGGCAAKLAATELRAILAKIKFPPVHSSVLVDGRDFDDAAIYKINEELALVQTLDFFTPIVDDPKTFGAIAAANALSDIYAMGGTPSTALAILAFPVSEFAPSIVQDILQGACDVLTRGNTSFVGGHSIDDASLKFGLSVSGFVHPQCIWSNKGAKQGDRIILTKALGTGTLCAGIKQDVWTASQTLDAIQSMTQLNSLPEILSQSEHAAIHAATDITGFGLSGHSLNVAKASKVTLQIETSKLPFFALTLESLKRECLTKAHRTNREYTQALASFPSDPILELAIHDPQTSGGLLLFVEPDQASSILQKIQSSFPFAKEIGHVSKLEDKLLRFN